MGERISRILRDECGASSALTEELAELTVLLSAAEEEFFEGGSESHENWKIDIETVENCFKEEGFHTEIKTLEYQEERLITKRDLENWFDAERSSWGSFISNRLGEKSFMTLRSLLAERISRGPLPWKWKSLLLKAML
jgi:hypothetical protein